MSLEVCRTLQLGLWQSSEHFRSGNRANPPKSTEDAARLFLRRAQRPIQWKEVCQHRHEHQFLLMAPPGQVLSCGNHSSVMEALQMKRDSVKVSFSAWPVNMLNAMLNAEHFDNFCR